MSAVYNPEEIIQFALQIEKNGQDLYNKLEKRFSEEKKLAALFAYLAEQEVNHKKYFETLLAEITSFTPAEDFPEEYFAYLKAFADNAVFSKKTVEEALTTISDGREALEFSIQRELDSINYYSELKNLVSDEQSARIDSIIREEKRHFLDLYKLLHQL